MNPSPQEAEKRSDYLLPIQAKLYGWSGSNAVRAKRLEASIETVTDLMNGQCDEFSLSELTAIARKIGITLRVGVKITSHILFTPSLVSAAT